MATLSQAVLALLLWNSPAIGTIFQRYETPTNSLNTADANDGRFDDIKLETDFQPLKTEKTRPDTLSKRSGFYEYPWYPSEKNVSCLSNRPALAVHILSIPLWFVILNILV